MVRDVNERTKLTLLASEETADFLRAMALALGYVVPVGSHVGQGSISQLLGALAGGDVDPGEFVRAMQLAASTTEGQS